MFKLLLAIVLIAFGAADGLAAPNEGLTLTPQGNTQGIDTNGDPCGAIELPAACENTGPNATPDADGIEWFLVLAAGDQELAFSTITFGIGDYDPVACYMASWGPCFSGLGPLEIPSDGWPGPFSGTSVSWSPECLTGNLVPVYSFGFYVYYGGGEVPLGDYFPGQAAAVVSCDDSPVEDLIAAFGSMGCGDASGARACPGPQPEFGACCLPSGVCIMLTEDECLASGYDFVGGSCDPNPCVGACCVDEECFLVSEDECQAMGGEWDGSPSCQPNPCLDPVGACCVDEECFLVTEAECQAMGGEWDGSPTCNPNPCLPDGACCVGEECFLVTEAECQAMGGEWDGSPTCNPNPCPGGSQEGVVLTVHGNVQCVETNGDPCGAIGLPSTCEETDPNACPDGNGVEWFLAVAAGLEELDFTTITFGIGNYDPDTCLLAAYGPCFPELAPLEISSDGWPGPFSGTSVTWAPNCLEGMLVPVYYFGFYVYYGGGPVPLGNYYPGQPAAVVSCDDPPVEDAILSFGAMGCGDSPGVRVCPEIQLGVCCVDLNEDGNPETCILVQSADECESQGGIYQGDGTACGPNNEPCPEDPVATRKTTWGRIKAMYRD